MRGGREGLAGRQPGKDCGEAQKDVLRGHQLAASLAQYITGILFCSCGVLKYYKISHQHLKLQRLHVKPRISGCSEDLAPAPPG